MKTKILAKVGKCEISQIANFFKYMLYYVILRDMWYYYVTLKAAVKLPNPFLKPEYQDSGKSCKIRNFVKY